MESDGELESYLKNGEDYQNSEENRTDSLIAAQVANEREAKLNDLPHLRSLRKQLENIYFPHIDSNEARKTIDDISSDIWDFGQTIQGLIEEIEKLETD